MYEELHRLNVAMVVVDPAGGPTPTAPTIGTTNWAGGLAAMDHLISLGHRRIGVIAGPRTLIGSRARLDGYRAGIEAGGLAFEDELVYEGDFYHESGFAGANAFLALHDPPTAIAAASDMGRWPPAPFSG